MEEICVLIAQKKRKGFKRYEYKRKVIKSFDAALDIYTIFRPTSAFTGRRVKKIVSKYKLVYSHDFCFKKHCKEKGESLLNFLPFLSLNHLVKDKNFDITKEVTGIVIKSRKLVNINFLSRLLKNVKYISIYNSTNEINNIFMEATGLCAVKGRNFNERLIIILDDNISFIIDNMTYTDAQLSAHRDFLDKDYPSQEILKDLLKVPDAEKLMIKHGLKITNII